MWIVLKYKKNELHTLKQELKNILGESPKFFIPKIKFQKIKKNKSQITKKELLNDYLFCYHEKFLKLNFSIFGFIKGLKYCLSKNNSDHKDVLNFVNICKKYQDNDGCLKQEFFSYFDFKKGIFLTGPLANLFFDLVEKQKNNLKVSVGNLSVVINKKSNCLYRPT